MHPCNIYKGISIKRLYISTNLGNKPETHFEDDSELTERASFKFYTLRALTAYLILNGNKARLSQLTAFEGNDK